MSRAKQIAAKFADYPKISLNECDEFIIGATAKELQELLHYINSAGSVNQTIFDRAKVALDIRLAEEAAASANKIIQHTDTLTKQTDKLITESVNLSRLTRVLIWITVALGLFALIQIVLMVFDIWKHK